MNPYARAAIVTHRAATRHGHPASFPWNVRVPDLSPDIWPTGRRMFHGKHLSQEEGLLGKLRAQRTASMNSWCTGDGMQRGQHVAE